MLRGVTDRAPLRFSAERRRVWERIYGQTETQFLDTGNWGAHIADKVCGDLWTSGGRRRPAVGPKKMPNPYGMIEIGYTIVVWYFDPARGDVVKMPYRRIPECLWSEHLQAVLLFPNMQLPPATAPSDSVPELLRLYRKWHDGKYPRAGTSWVDTPEPVFQRIYPGIAVTYRSDKFDGDGEFVDYIHHFDPGAWGEPGPKVFVHGDCVMIRGGRLALTRDGLIH